jgi:pSer/pThr/pTyr-binding forkhead associated (FHA) protein
VIEVNSGTEMFNYNATGLTYYVRTYATTSKGTVYGNEVDFVPQSPYYVKVGDIGVQKTDISSNISWNSANNLCEGSTVGGYTDWRLPTMNELNAIYVSRSSIGMNGSGGSNISCSRFYWSSTELNESAHAAVSFYDGNTYNMSNGTTNGNGGTYYDNSRCYSTSTARCVRTLP